MLSFNNAPYFDDFDKGNKFYRILYRPSYAVQGRELTQSQSITQEQIKKFGDHIFQHGAMVIPGQITFDKDVSYQKMNTTYGIPPFDVAVDPVNFLGYTVIGESSGVEGDIVNVTPADSTDPLTMFVKFKDSGNDNESIAFWDGETVYRKDDSTIRATVQGTLDEVNPTYDESGKASITSIDKGVYYIDGIFVDNDAQSIVVGKYTQKPTAKIGLRIYESVISPEEDLSLTDNAQGSPNYAAPGAHRYKIDLKLESLDYEADVSDDFVILQYIKKGSIVKEIRISSYAELEKTFARRTYDESGHYTVNPFAIIMKEHYRDEDDDTFKEGVFFPPDGDKAKLIAEMGKGKAYVQGYEVLKISNTNLVIDKARDFMPSNNSVTNFSLGNYIKVNNTHNIPRIDEFGEVMLYDTVSATPGVPSGLQVGTARVRAIKSVIETDAGGTIIVTSYLYLFDVQMNAGESFETAVRGIYDSNGNGINNFTCDPLVEDGKVFIYKVDDNKMIFNLPHSTIKTLSVDGAGIDTNYQSMRAYFNTGIVANTATLVAKDNEVFQQDTSSYYINYVSDGTSVVAPTFNFVGSPTGKVLEIGNLNGAVNIIAPVSKMISTQKTKYLQYDATVTIAVPNKKPNDKDYLGKADITQIKTIYMSANLTTPPTTSDTDITDRYIKDTGQKDNYYDVGYITLKGGQSAPTGQIMVVFDYFTHSDGDYFSIDSYVDIDFDEIPIYESNESGESYALADCFDFRPRMADDRSGFTGSGASIGEIPQVFSDIRSDYEYYLNRIDYIYLDYTGEFKVAKGISAIHPVPPEKPETGMVLYETYVDAYTFSPSDASPVFKDNRRYTMKDIGDLDRRIGKLEYYTALSILERETASMEILDQNGLNRFKNGFIVDPFDSHNVGDASHSDYNCAIDPEDRKMRPKFNDENIGLMFDEDSSTHVRKTGGIITLPYTDTPINKQTQASKYENINPFAFRNIFGKIVFNPDSDVWHDKKKIPALIVNNSPNYEALKKIAQDKADLEGVEWGRWKDVGGKKDFKKGKSTTEVGKSKIESRRDTGISHDKGWLRRVSPTKITTKTTWKQDQTREGTKTVIRDSVVTKSLGDRITEVNYIPYMRSIPVLVKTDQMKKNTKLYPFFDDIAMSPHCEPPSKYKYCTPASIFKLDNINGDFNTLILDEENISGTISTATAMVVFQGDDYINVVNIKGTFQDGEPIVGLKSGATATIVTTEIKVKGDAILSGDNGEVALIWNIPNDDTLKFMTGERDFVLTDQITNVDPVHTFATGPFKSHGMSSKSQETVLSTKTIVFDKVPVKQAKTIEKKGEETKEGELKGRWFDPIAQSFLINESGGCFLTKVRVWFQSKDKSEACVCEIRNMVNGYPSGIALTSLTMQPKNIKVSEREPGEPTDLVFPEPIYLKEGEDYCFVLKPAVSSASYNIWVAENGRKDYSTGEVITGKESLGSLFKSQNASTWTANQNEDIMFTLFKATFDISSDGNVQLVNDEIEAEILDPNPLETYKGTNRVRIYHHNHALTLGSKYFMSGFVDGTDYNGYLGSELNGEHTVVDLEMDTFVIIMGTPATEDGKTGGNEIYGVKNYQLDVASPLVNELILDNTQIDWSLTTTTGTSVNGSQIPYISMPSIDVVNNEDVNMTAPMIIASKYNEAEFLATSKSLRMIGTMISENENVSPIVDAAAYDATTDKGSDLFFKQSTSTFISVGNRVDFPETTTMAITAPVFAIGVGEDELIVSHPDHELGTGSFVLIEGFTDSLDIAFDPNGLHEIRVTDKDTYLIDTKENSVGGYPTGTYTGDGGGGTTITHSQTHYKFVPESRSFDCSTASRYITKQVTLQDPAENFKMFFGAVREQDADIDVYYKIRGPYEVTEWNEIDWVRLDSPDENVAISQSYTDFKEYSYNIEDLEPFNSISVKLVMKSTNSTQVPIFTDFRLICTT